MLGLCMPAGNIAKKQSHAPIAQKRLRSLDERRFIILTIRGIFQRGSIMLAIKAVIYNSVLMNPYSAIYPWH